MSEDQRFERGARAWLDEGPTRAPERAVTAALAEIDATPQERSLRVPWRMPVMTLPVRLAAVALLVALAAGGTLLVAGALPDSAPLVTPTPAYDVRVTYQAVPDAGRTPTTEDLEVIRAIVEARLQNAGVATLRVRVEEPDRVVVEFAPAIGGDEVRELAGTTGRVDFVPLGDVAVAAGDPIDLGQHPPLFGGDQVASASYSVNPAGGHSVDLTLRDEARRVFADYTTANVGASFAIALDGVVLTAPVIRDPILGGQVQISMAGDATQAAAQRLITVLRLGQLPYPLREIAVDDL